MCGEIIQNRDMWRNNEAGSEVFGEIIYNVNPDL
jgi:hypothetical protein